MKGFFASVLILIVVISAYCQEGPKNRFGLSAGGNYTFSGVSTLLSLELHMADHIIYTGPRLPLSRSYLPLRNPFGWNFGYRYEYMKKQDKVVSFFFNADYQIAFSESFSHVKETDKLNYVHELFVGYGVQFKLSPRIYLVNVLGVGGHLESYYNADLEVRKKFFGYNNLIKLFLNYRFGS